MIELRKRFRLAVGQPSIRRGEDASYKVDEAVELIATAAARGAELLVLPEGYPGPLRIGEAYEAGVAIAQAAAHGRCAVYWSRIERGAGGRHETVGYLVEGDGRTVVRYPRSHPATGDVHPRLNGAPMAPGPDLVTATVGGVTVGLLVCSELWLPEVSRVLVLRGAQILLAPAGGGFGAVAGNWQLLARARAIENECYVALTQNRIDGEPGTALITGPEHELARSSTEELVLADLDLDRARWLRDQDDSMVSPKPFSSLPGLLRARRPELYGELWEARSNGYDYEAASRDGEVAG